MELKKGKDSQKTASFEKSQTKALVQKCEIPEAVHKVLQNVKDL